MREYVFSVQTPFESFLLLLTIRNVHMMIIIKEHLAVIRQDIDL